MPPKRVLQSWLSKGTFVAVGNLRLAELLTTKETRYVSNIDYFGEPVYQSSPRPGIEDEVGQERLFRGK